MAHVLPLSLKLDSIFTVSENRNNNLFSIFLYDGSLWRRDNKYLHENVFVQISTINRSKPNSL